MREGDIFRWGYIKPDYDQYPYHCASCIAIFNGKVLRDTYWSSGMDGKRFKPSEIGERIEVEFIANFDELEQVGDYARPKYYYKPEHIVDLNHSNSSRGNLYIRKGAERDEAVMRGALLSMRLSRQRAIDSVKRDIERIDQITEELDTKSLDQIRLPGLEKAW